MIRSHGRIGVTLLFLAGLSMGAAGPVELVKGGRCDHRIVVQPGASPSERFAAQELQTHFKACTDIELPIVEGVFRILHENAAPGDILDELLLRDPKPELSPELLWGGRKADS